MQTEDESVADFKACLEALFSQHSEFHSINEVTQPALAALFVNRFSPEINGLIKMQKKRWETMGLTELMNIARHFERTLEQDHKDPPIYWLYGYNSSEARDLK